MFGFFKKNNDKNKQNPKKIIDKDSIELYQQARMTNDPKIAVELYSDAIDVEKQKESPNRELISEIYQWRGELYLGLQVAILSSSDFLHSIDFNPKNAISHNNLAIWLTMPQFAKPDLDRAIEHLNKAIELAPERLDFQMSRAVIRIKNGDRETGRTELEDLDSKGYENAKIAIERFL
jgi:tetratricopeptide (TPR) repeat protein